MFLGKISLDRKLIQWEWFQKPEYVQLWIYILLKVNHKEGRWQGHIIKRGQMITSLDHIKRDTGLTKQKIRTILKKLTHSGEIVKKSTHQFTLLTVCNYDIYQTQNLQTNTQLTHDQHTTNTQLTLNNNKGIISNNVDNVNNNFIPQNFENLVAHTKAFRDITGITRSINQETLEKLNDFIETEDFEHINDFKRYVTIYNEQNFPENINKSLDHMLSSGIQKQLLLKYM